MIKINKTLGLALLTALAASCSSNEEAVQNNPVAENGEAAYATLRINLPAQPSSRAVDIDQEGLPSEYKVNDATLLVFKKAGSSEGDYTFQESVPLGNMNPWDNLGGSGVQTTAETTAKFGTTTYADLTAGNIYGLVILNNGSGTSQKITLPTAGQTFSAWNNKASNVTAANMTNVSNGIVMANAPEWKESGTAPLTLVPIDGTKVQPTAAKAEAAGPAANIYVERGLAKVTMEDVPNMTPTGSTYKSDEVGIFAWTLDVTNKSSYPVHNVDGLATDYADIWKSDGTASANDNSPSVRRFVDGANSTFKRVYWGKDPNYDQNITDVATAFNLATTKDLTTDAAKAFGDANPKYCLENTFDIDHMTQNQTTRVLFQAIYKVNGTTAATFYKIGDQSGLYNEENLKNLINTIVKNVTGKVVGKDYTLDLGKIATEAGGHDLTDANFTAVASPAKAFTRGTDEAEAGDGTKNNILSDDQISKVNAQLNGQIKTYLNGVCYYIGRIKHFGNDETPWNQGDPTYDGKNLEYLGRYGVLRNNWYSLSVNSVSGPGEPVIPETPDTPDDDNHNYINLSVKVLKWAKRGQVLHF